MFKIFITDLAAYNSGYLVGGWLELPVDDDDIDEIIDETFKEGEEKCGDPKDSHEEVFISAFEGPGMSKNYDKYSSPYRVNEDINDLTVLSRHYDEEVIGLLLEYFKMYEVISIFESEDFIVSHVKNKKEFARDYVDQFLSCNNRDMPNWIFNHIDYKSIYECELRHTHNLIVNEDETLIIEILE